MYKGYLCISSCICDIYITYIQYDLIYNNIYSLMFDSQFLYVVGSC